MVVLGVRRYRNFVSPERECSRAMWDERGKEAYVNMEEGRSEGVEYLTLSSYYMYTPVVKYTLAAIFVSCFHGYQNFCAM